MVKEHVRLRLQEGFRKLIKEARNTTREYDSVLFFRDGAWWVCNGTVKTSNALTLGIEEIIAQVRSNMKINRISFNQALSLEIRLIEMMIEQHFEIDGRG